MPIFPIETGVKSHPGYVSGRYYQGFRDVYSDTTSSTGFVINFISYYLLKIYDQVTMTRLAVYVGSSIADANLRLGIYSNQNGIPLDLLVDGGNLVAATAGAKESIISLPLQAGEYWLGGVTTKAPSLYASTAFLGTNHDLGQLAPTSLSANCGLRNTLEVAPNTMPVIAPMNNPTFLTGNVRPMFWFKAA